MLQQKSNNASGNILIYILGAIFLMGMLIVALKGSFQEGTGIDPEKTALLVGQVQRYGAELERGVRYVQQNGYSESDIRFAHPNASSAYGLITDIPRRQVFDPQGGGVEWRDPWVGSQVTTAPWAFNAVDYVPEIGSTCSGSSSCVDFLAVLPYVTRDFCLTLNNAVGVTNPAGNPPKESSGFHALSHFAGTISSTPGELGVTGGYLRGKSEGCFEGNTADPNLALTGSYYYYRVLLAR